ncbi:alpha-hydroxy-acid oxidizing enzyme [Mesorhizobium sp. L-8-10]|uniref:alpha-hydroxy acid oxidase n=1 Tax=unclassified Mesorhizobium TaxID=325217 RepID=UPI0019264799|nr:MULTISPECIES: alpha-hydroxy acid oxidase [unclassified Mesorhizobium]BCH25965.1 alpha-hydroxy-acid oxidizing enzyme [Mesorhizobium sp. L-8-3]BCH33950.1 alpha-hydroxy-acid oxidizing enzyme [Mesorhizobium sp. L-8-10]
MLLNTGDYRERARRKLPRGLFEYIDRGTEDELALSRLRSSLDSVVLRPSVLSGHARREPGTTLFGRRFPTPLVIAPTALAGLVAHNGELKLARAAAALGIPFSVSTQSVTTIEEIRRAAQDATLWFQLYVWRDRTLTADLLKRVRACDCECLVVTADTQMSPNREYNQRNGFGIPFKPTLRNLVDMAVHPRWLLGVMLRYMLAGGVPTYGHYPAEYRSAITRANVQEAVRLETNLSWGDVKRLRDEWPGKLVVKGVLSIEDAELALAVGVDGVVVSAHGGRNLDCLPSTASCLSAIAEAFGDRMTILADSGVRRGTDVLKYLAMGAQGVMLGRLPLWGLAAGDEEGASSVLAMMLREMDTAMGLLGVADIAALRSPARWGIEAQH